MNKPLITRERWGQALCKVVPDTLDAVAFVTLVYLIVIFLSVMD